MRIHVYVGWKVVLHNGNNVHFVDQKKALEYFVNGKEMVRTVTEIQCGLERGRKFCSHCKAATSTEERNV